MLPEACVALSAHGGWLENQTASDGVRRGFRRDRRSYTNALTSSQVCLRRMIPNPQDSCSAMTTASAIAVSCRPHEARSVALVRSWTVQSLRPAGRAMLRAAQSAKRFIADPQAVCSGFQLRRHFHTASVIRDRIEPAVSPVVSAVASKAEA